MQPEDLTNYLNEYFSEMTTIALFYGATIDKYIGDYDGFGDPETNGRRCWLWQNGARARSNGEVKGNGKMKVLQIF